MKRLDDIKARAAAATEGELSVNEHQPDWLTQSMEERGEDTDGHEGLVSLVSSIGSAGYTTIAGSIWPHRNAKNNMEFFAHARADTLRLVAALEAVLALHSKNRYEACNECYDRSLNTWADLVPYPCPTVTAIREALGEETT